MIKKFIEQSNSIDAPLINQLSIETGLCKELVQLFANRGYTKSIEIESFLNPKISDLYDPLQIPDMEKASNVIKDHISKGNKICIYGDYDVDGVCSISILYKQLKKMGANVSYFIPSRLTDGYGMSLNTVASLCNKGYQLIITVDNGINSIEEVDYCNKNGVDVVITDHHIQGESIPDAKAVVASSRTDSLYLNPFLCGAAVAFKLATVLNSGKIDEEFLGLAAIATISDIVPLNFENHSIVKLGIPYFGKNRGIQALLESSGYEAFDEQSISFFVSPRINAAGRMGSADVACELLLSGDDPSIRSYIKQLNDYNDQRKAEEEKILSELTSEGISYEQDSAIIKYNPNWHVGVLGIVANRLSKMYNKPAILFTDSKGEIIGSGRSGDNVDLYDTLKEFESYFIRFGGHSKAAGLTISKSKLEPFIKDYQTYISTQYKDSIHTSIINYDSTIQMDKITDEFTDALENMKPFGEGFKEPIFCIKNTSLLNIKKIGKNGQYISCDVDDGLGKLKMVSFLKSLDFNELMQFPSTSVYCRIRNNYFKGFKTKQLQLEDFMPSNPCNSISSKKELHNAILYQLLYNYHCLFSDIKDLFEKSQNNCDLESSFDENSMRIYYSQLRKMADLSAGRIPVSELNEELLISLCVFWELNFFQKDENDNYFRKIDNVQHRLLTDSVIYQIISKIN